MSRSTNDITFLAQQARENAAKGDRQSILVFLILSKAFERVNHEILYDMMELMRIPVTFLNAVRRFYRKRSVKLTLGQATTDKLDYEHGAIQGGPLSALLYILFGFFSPFHLDEVPQSETSVPVNNLGFMSDWVLMSESKADMQKSPSVAATTAALLGLVFNTSKFKYIVDSRKSSFRITFKDIVVEDVDN